MEKIALSISSLIYDPNFEDAINVHIPEEQRRNRVEFDRVAKEWTLKYAIEELSAKEQN